MSTTLIGALIGVLVVGNAWFISSTILLKDRIQRLEDIAVTTVGALSAIDMELEDHEQNLKSLPEVITAEVTSIFSDPDRVDRELERSAELTELRRANRKHKVRDDAGQPAKSHRLNISRG